MSRKDGTGGVTLHIIGHVDGHAWMYTVERPWSSLARLFLFLFAQRGFRTLLSLSLDKRSLIESLDY